MWIYFTLYMFYVLSAKYCIHERNVTKQQGLASVYFFRYNDHSSVDINNTINEILMYYAIYNIDSYCLYISSL